MVISQILFTNIYLCKLIDFVYLYTYYITGSEKQRHKFGDIHSKIGLKY